jgi:pyruvate kinase
MRETMQRRRNAKIVATIGPASASEAMLRKLFLGGADVFRLNFSHGEHAQHAAVFAAIRRLEQEFDRPIAVLQDLQGPKIRVGRLPNDGIELVGGTRVRFALGGGERAIELPHPEIFAAVAPGQRLLFDDGRLSVTIEKVRESDMDAVVETGGRLQSRKGVNLPGTLLPLSPLTEKDRRDLAFGLELGVDLVALSFVQSPADMLEARAIIGDRAGLIAKIEKPAALTRFDDIARLSDGVMIARGDLGVEIPAEEVPAKQKELVRICRAMAKPVIVATQMLDSMVNSPAPTRAETSDVATALYDGADAVMLSAESASGKYPLEAVTMMDKIIRTTERHDVYQKMMSEISSDIDSSASHAVAESAAWLAGKTECAVIVAYTSSGVTAARIARERPKAPILALSPDPVICRRLNLLWGTYAALVHQVGTYEEMVQHAEAMAIRRGFAVTNGLIAIVAGMPFGQSGTTNNVRLLRVAAATPGA